MTIRERLEALGFRAGVNKPDENVKALLGVVESGRTWSDELITRLADENSDLRRQLAELQKDRL